MQDAPPTDVCRCHRLGYRVIPRFRQIGRWCSAGAQVLGHVAVYRHCAPLERKAIPFSGLPVFSFSRLPAFYRSEIGAGCPSHRNRGKMPLLQVMLGIGAGCASHRCLMPLPQMFVLAAGWVIALSHDSGKLADGAPLEHKFWDMSPSIDIALLWSEKQSRFPVFPFSVFPASPPSTGLKSGQDAPPTEIGAGCPSYR